MIWACFAVTGPNRKLLCILENSGVGYEAICQTVKAWLK